jgi:hypothetical protein
MALMRAKPASLLRFTLWLLLALGGFGAMAGRADPLTITQILASFDSPGTLNVKVDVDLTIILGASPEAYYQFATASPAARQETMKQILPAVRDNIQLFVGDQPLQLVLQGYTVPTASHADFEDASLSKLTTFHFIAVLPDSKAPIRLLVPLGASIDFPVAFTVQIPSAHLSVTRWLESGVHESNPVEWASHAPQVGAEAAPATAVVERAGGAQPPAAARAELDVDAMSWHQQLAMYLRLGFSHIVPGGVDHILFVLGLFFLGITWRKLLSQTSVFTVAHATTLFLSSYGFVTLPGRYIEPLIALSIAFIAIENVFWPQLGVWRLAVVFAFGLIHGLGFARALNEIPFPKHQFVVALLGFNFGVDLGQLFIIALAFIAVGRFRKRPWFRTRIAVPCSLFIAAIGLLWAVQRIIFYAHHS